MIRTRASGFALIEHMIAAAVVSIMTVVSLPTYTTYVARTHRSLTQQTLVDIVQRQDQYMSMARGYATALTSTGLNFTPSSRSSDWSCSSATECQNANWTITLTVDNAAVPPAFRVTATPKANGLNRDDAALSIDSTGTRSGPWTS